MKTWKCPIDGSYVKNDDKCPKCELTYKQADEKAQLDAERDRQYDNGIILSVRSNKTFRKCAKNDRYK